MKNKKQMNIPIIFAEYFESLIFDIKLLIFNKLLFNFINYYKKSKKTKIIKNE